MEDKIATAPAMKSVLAQLPVADWRRLKIVAAENDRTIQGLVGEAVNGILAKYDRHPPVE